MCCAVLFVLYLRNGFATPTQISDRTRVGLVYLLECNGKVPINIVQIAVQKSLFKDKSLDNDIGYFSW